MTSPLDRNIISNMKIMIVDDEEDICFILGFELKSLGHEIVSFTSSLEAREFLKTESFDAILCDFQMPKMNGLDLFLWLKKEGKKIPFYILTGEPTMDTHQLLENGVKDILFKPGDLLRLPQIFK